MRNWLLWLTRRFDIYEAGHHSGPMTCARYPHHIHLPLDLIKWFPAQEEN